MGIKHLIKVFSLLIITAMIFSIAIPLSAITITGEVPDGWTATGRSTYYNSTIYQNSQGITVQQNAAGQHSGIAYDAKVNLNEPVTVKFSYNQLPGLYTGTTVQNGLYIAFCETPEMMWYGVQNSFATVGKMYGFQLSDNGTSTRLDTRQITAAAEWVKWTGSNDPTTLPWVRPAVDTEYTITFAPHATKGYELTINGTVMKGPAGVDLILTALSNAITAGTISNELYFSIGLNDMTNPGASITVTELNGVSMKKLNNEISVQKSGEDFIVGITDWQADHQYQIWTYQETESEIFGGEGTTNEWHLSLPYTLGSDRTAGGFTEDGDAITRNIGQFASVDSNYTIAVRIIDDSGNYVGQFKDTYTPEDVGEVVINKVEVDGTYADERAQVKEITNGATVSMMIYGNGVEGTVFSARVDTTGEVLTPLVESPNAFEWNIGLLDPGSYSVTFTAETATSSDSRTINFKLYKNDPEVVYGELTGLAVTGGAEGGNFKIDMTPSVTGGKFRYRLSEPWRAPFIGGDSGLIDIPGGVVSNTVIPETAYGIYQVATYTYRLGVASADDGAIRTVNNERGGVSLGVDVYVNETPAAGDPIAAVKGDGIIIEAAATGIPTPSYSFWRRDANGWVMIRDYDVTGMLVWTPNRVGLYTIQVRAKDAAGLTYEAVQNIEFDITDAVDTKAVVTDITINQATLDSDAKARTPITITANAVSASEDLLYKFIISNGYIYYVETAYSVDPTYIWVPGKAGDYTISVLVKNRVSFGKYDAVGSFTVNVN